MIDNKALGQNDQGLYVFYERKEQRSMAVIFVNLPTDAVLEEVCKDYYETAVSNYDSLTHTKNTYFSQLNCIREGIEKLVEVINMLSISDAIIDFGANLYISNETFLVSNIASRYNIEIISFSDMCKDFTSWVSSEASNGTIRNNIIRACQHLNVFTKDLFASTDISKFEELVGTGFGIGKGTVKEIAELQQKLKVA